MILYLFSGFHHAALSKVKPGSKPPGMKQLFKRSEVKGAWYCGFFETENNMVLPRKCVLKNVSHCHLNCMIIALSEFTQKMKFKYQQLKLKN